MTLQQWIDENSVQAVELETFLQLALGLTAAIGEQHAQDGLHGSVNPDTVRVMLSANSQNKTRHSAPQITLLPPHSDQPLPYIAPEQTGRINQPCDQRTDLYALGIIFYRLATGELPFVADDMVALIHAHVAVPATFSADSTLPIPLQQLILKLLAKAGQDRYQSAAGLLIDLQRCWESWNATGDIPPFTLGQMDMADNLRLETLHGRAQEQEKLLAALHDGDIQLLLIGGRSGVGKTSLVRELRGPVHELDGMMWTHSAEMESATAPYAAVIGLLDSFVRQLLTGEKARLSTWRGRLSSALAGHVTRLVKHIPALAALLAVPPDQQAQIDYPQLMLKTAIQAFFTAALVDIAPLAIVLDDAHHADVESLHLLHDLTQTTAPQLLMIWVYRTDQPLPALLQAQSTHLLLRPLSLADTHTMVAQTIYADAEQLRGLSRLVYDKTNGNPMFVREFLQLLYRRGLIRIDFTQRCWTWELPQIEAAPIADNVAALVQNRLQTLPEPQQKLLKVAAHLGRRFDVTLLAIVMGQTVDATTLQVRHFQNMGIVLPLYASTRSSRPENNPWADAVHEMTTHFRRATDGEPAHTAHAPLYRFAHEQIHNAVFLLLPAVTDEQIHVRVGRMLWDGLSSVEHNAHIFQIVRHFNRLSIDTLTWIERVTVAEINLAAGRKSNDLASFHNGHTFAQHGIDCLDGERGWREQPILMRDLHMTMANALPRFGAFDQTTAVLSEIENRATSLLDRLTVTEVRMPMLYLQGRYEEAVITALAALQKLDVRLVYPVGKRHIAHATTRIEWALRGRKPDELAQLRPMSDPQQRKAIELMAATTISAASVSPELLLLLGLEILQRTLRHGAHPLSAMGYALYGLLLCSIGRIERGYIFGQLALRVGAQIEIKEYAIFVKYFVHAHIFHWKDHIETTLQPIRDSEVTGDYEYFAVAAGLYPYFTWFISKMDFATAERALADSMQILEPFEGMSIHYRYQLGWQYYRNLLGMADDPCELVGAAYNERQLQPVHLREKDYTTLFFAACHKLTLCYLFGDFERAVAAARRARKYARGGTGTPLIPVLNFYESLARLRLAAHSPKRKAAQLLVAVVANQRKLRRWADHSPENCLHRYTLVEAERARLFGRNTQAADLYATAIHKAQTQRFLPELAVAHEAAGHFYAEIGRSKSARHHLQQARDHFATWGAIGKVRQLDERLQLSAPERVPDLSTQLDLNSIIRLGQTLSRETELPRLIETLSAILIENAHAQYGHLLLPTENGWQIVGAQANDATHAIDMAIVQQVAERFEPVLLNGEDGPQQPIGRSDMCSILCLPLLDRGEAVGVFYMENRPTQHAIASERVPVLMLLARQAAIALKNARLVTRLQETQRHIQLSEQRFRLLFQNAPVAIMEVDLVNDVPLVQTVNRRAQALYGISAEKFATMPLSTLMDDNSQAFIPQMLNTVRAGQNAILEAISLRSDGNPFPVRIVATPAPDKDGSRIIVVVEDRTARQQRQSQVEAIEADRQRIAQEIHDGVAQNLAFLRLRPVLWRSWMTDAPALLQADFDQTETILDEAIVELRRSIHALRPLALDRLGLYAMLPRYIADFNDRHDVYVSLHLAEKPPTLPNNLELLLFRIVQEMLNNIAKHAKASLAHVALTATNETLTLTVSDNGVGFDAVNLQVNGRSDRLGLVQMRERVAAVAGRLDISSRPGSTEIRVVLPLTVENSLAFE